MFFFPSSTKDATYNEDDNSVRMFIRGRPVTLFAHSVFGQDYQNNVSGISPLTNGGGDGEDEHDGETSSSASNWVPYSLAKVTPAPQQRPKLEWVYGYRGRDARSNLYLLPTGEMVYFVASVVVLFNAEEHSQRHYLGHTEDIKW